MSDDNGYLERLEVLLYSKLEQLLDECRLDDVRQLVEIMQELSIV